jgi:hypothetical protein
VASVAYVKSVKLSVRYQGVDGNFGVQGATVTFKNEDGSSTIETGSTDQWGRYDSGDLGLEPVMIIVEGNSVSDPNGGDYVIAEDLTSTIVMTPMPRPVYMSINQLPDLLCDPPPAWIGDFPVELPESPTGDLATLASALETFLADLDAWKEIYVTWCDNWLTPGWPPVQHPDLPDAPPSFPSVGPYTSPSNAADYWDSLDEWIADYADFVSDYAQLQTDYPSV